MTRIIGGSIGLRVCVRGIHPYAQFKSQQSDCLLLTTTGEVFGDVWGQEVGGGGGIVATSPRD